MTNHSNEVPSKYLDNRYENREWQPPDAKQFSEEEMKRRAILSERVANYAVKKYQKGRTTISPKAGIFRSVWLEQIDMPTLQAKLAEHGLRAQPYEHLRMYDGGGAAGEIWEERIKLIKLSLSEQYHDSQSQTT